MAFGGGLANALGGTLTTMQTGIRDNIVSAPGGTVAQGGGLYNATGSTTLTGSTVTHNTAGDGGGIYEASGTVTLDTTVVEFNEPNNCAPPGSVPGCTG